MPPFECINFVLSTNFIGGKLPTGADEAHTRMRKICCSPFISTNFIGGKLPNGADLYQPILVLPNKKS